MSLEAALAAHTEALNAHREALTENNRLLVEAAAGRQQVLAAAQIATAPKTSTRSVKKVEETPEPAAEPTQAEAEQSIQTEQPAASAPRDLSDDPLGSVITEYVAGATRPEERTARAAKIKTMFGQVGATKHSEVPADKVELFIKSVRKAIENGDLTTPEPAAAEPELLG